MSSRRDVKRESHHGKAWLVVRHGGTKYQIPLDPVSRYQDGLILFGSEDDPPLVLGTMAWGPFLEQVLAAVPGANRELERFQAPEVLRQGGALEWSTPEEAYRDMPLFE